VGKTDRELKNIIAEIFKSKAVLAGPLTINCTVHHSIGHLGVANGLGLKILWPLAHTAKRRVSQIDIGGTLQACLRHPLM